MNLTKLHIPQSKPNLVQRSHLIDLLNKGINRKLTLISAPAGFGKTTVLTKWISRSNLPVVWISLDNYDNDPFQFLNYFIAAVRNKVPGFGKKNSALLHSRQLPTVDMIMANLINELVGSLDRLVFVYDDYHLIDSEIVHNLLKIQLSHQTNQFPIVLSTRADPPLPLARMRANEDLTEIRTSDICFSIEETAQFFKNSQNLELTNRELELLASRTEGWAAALQLAALSIKGQDDIASFLNSFAGDDRFIVDYLTEEVLNLQPEPIQTFLLETSLLDRLSKPLCDYVTERTDSHEILERLETLNLFVIRLDHKRHWFRYHHLFADLLKQRLKETGDDSVAKLHKRASEWYLENGFEDEAISHTLASEDFEKIATLIEGQADKIWTKGDHAKFQSWLEKLPDEIVRSKPLLSILNAETMMTSWRMDDAEQNLKNAEQALASTPDASSGKMKMLGRISANFAIIESFKENIPEIIRHAKKALEMLPEGEVTWRSSVAITLGDAHFIKGDFTAAHQAQQEALEICESSSNAFLQMIANTNLAVTLRQKGKLQQALEICLQQLQFAKENGMSHTIIAGWCYAILGEILAEMNNSDEAIEKAKRGVELAEKCGDEGGMLRDSYLRLTRVMYSMGDLAGAEEIIQKLDKLMRRSRGTTIIKSKSKAWKVRIWLAQNKHAAIEKWLEGCQVTVNDELIFLREEESTALARVMIFQNRLDDAINFLSKLYQSAQTGGRTVKMIELSLLQALTYQSEGEIESAITAVKHALNMAEPGQLIRIFLDEGQRIAELLEQISETNTDVSKPYVYKLLSAFKLKKLIKTDEEVIDRLSERELEVMRYIAAGLSNKRITEELYISMSTVKTHIRNIFSKLNVSNRTQAVNKAKELELI